MLALLPGAPHYPFMASFDAYEQNLLARLAELRAGDPAYEAHGNAILETLPYDAFSAPERSVERILDVGCGLGFVSLKLADFPDTQVIGIDPSQKAIELAKAEHAAQPNLGFLAASAEAFPEVMEREGIAPFDRAIINMVLHSIDDETCLRVLGGVRQALAPHGILICVVPGRDWLIQKLIEKAQAEDMSKKDGIPWIKRQLGQKVVDIAVNINGQPAYPEPISIWNRSLADYGRLLEESGYGLDVEVSGPEAPESARITRVPYWEWGDHLYGYELTLRNRHILMTQVGSRWAGLPV